MAEPAAAVGIAARLALVLACSALAGCSVLTSGRPIPADADGPRPVPVAALHNALLSSATVNDIMGATGMRVNDTRSRLFDGSKQFTDHACMIAWTPAEQTVYAHTEWAAVVAQTLLAAPGASSRFVIQSVVGFPSRARADQFFAKAVQKWMPCGDQMFVTSRGTGARNAAWTFDAVSTADSTLWMTQRQDDGSGWSCQRALRVSNNVAIDVLACKMFTADEAITIAQGIDARLPSV